LLEAAAETQGETAAPDGSSEPQPGAAPAKTACDALLQAVVDAATAEACEKPEKELLQVVAGLPGGTNEVSEPHPPVETVVKVDREAILCPEEPAAAAEDEDAGSTLASPETAAPADAPSDALAQSLPAADSDTGGATNTTPTTPGVPAGTAAPLDLPGATAAKAASADTGAQLAGETAVIAPRATRNANAADEPPAPQQDENGEANLARADRNVVAPERPLQRAALSEARVQPLEHDAQNPGPATRDEVTAARPGAKPQQHAGPLSDVRIAAPNTDTRGDAGQLQPNFADAVKLQGNPPPPLHAAAGSVAPSTSASPAQHTAPAPASAENATAVPLAGLAVEISARARAGAQRFEIRLDPPELGRIDVRLDVHRDGRVTSHLIVDRAETLDLLRRDALDLERALQQAGLRTSDQSLQFSLRDQSFTGREGGAETEGRAALIVADELEATLDASPVYANGLRLGGGLDIRV
jgi:flagellar hook-length control protein FliK